MVSWSDGESTKDSDLQFLASYDSPIKIPGTIDDPCTLVLLMIWGDVPAWQAREEMRGIQGDKHREEVHYVCRRRMKWKCPQ
ncbi:hypothetical protein ZWY2020_002968 [Hordeum vulgare]|nr:hypothetical protein ZWY2020_002968 [Hordeum vulgare]